MVKNSILLLSTVIMLSACSSSPTDDSAISDAEINAQALKAYQEVKAKSKMSTNKDWTAMVQRVADRIAKAAGENFKWEVVLIDSKEVNAWCMPGGKMAVYTGIMPVVQNEAALAAVMGHEVAHATRRHGKQRYARAMKSNMIGTIVGGAAVIGGQLLCKTNECRLLSGLGGVAAGFAVAFFDRKLSRGDETEADKYGQIYMARAGYEPSEAIKLWERMGAASGGKASPEFMSTHPSDVTRRGNLSEWLPEAEAVYRSAPAKYGLGERVM